MCILIVKPAGAQMPPKDIIHLCEKHNPDGFGYATRYETFKTMDRKEFERRLYSIPDDEPAIIHCRWATNGSIKESNCHPFFDKATGVAYAHNGVLSIPCGRDMTDSETAFRRFFVPAIKRYGLYSVQLQRVVERLIGYSKFAFIDSDGGLKTFGRFTEFEGCYYSNLRFIY